MKNFPQLLYATLWACYWMIYAVAGVGLFARAGLGVTGTLLAGTAVSLLGAVCIDIMYLQTKEGRV